MLLLAQPPRHETRFTTHQVMCTTQDTSNQVPEKSVTYQRANSPSAPLSPCRQTKVDTAVYPMQCFGLCAQKPCVLKGASPPSPQALAPHPRFRSTAITHSISPASSELPFLDCPQATPYLPSSPTITCICTRATSPAARSPSRSTFKPAWRLFSTVANRSARDRHLVRMT